MLKIARPSVVETLSAIVEDAHQAGIKVAGIKATSSNQ